VFVELLFYIFLFSGLIILKFIFGWETWLNNLISFLKLLGFDIASKIELLFNPIKLLLVLLNELFVPNKGISILLLVFSSICLACSSFNILFVNNPAYYIYKLY
jgi:hypothetical protein